MCYILKMSKTFFPQVIALPISMVRSSALMIRTRIALPISIVRSIIKELGGFSRVPQVTLMEYTSPVVTPRPGEASPGARGKAGVIL